MKTLALIFLAAGFLFLPESIFAEITVTNTKGQSMNVEVLKYTKSSGNVRIKRLPGGSIFNVKIKLFDSESQEKIIKAAPKPKAKLELKVSAGARRDDVQGSGFMERQKITATVEIENESRDIDLPETKLTILLVGRNTRRFADRDQDGAKILSKQTAKGAVPAGQTMKFEFKPVRTEYDEDKDSSNLGGWDYDGYLLVLQDKAGNVIEAKTSIGPCEAKTLKDPTLLKKALALGEGQQVDRSLTP